MPSASRSIRLSLTGQVVQCFDDARFDRRFQPAERERNLRRETRQRILAAEANEVNALAQVGSQRQVLAPGAIELVEHHGAGDRAGGVLADLVEKQRASRPNAARPPPPRHRAGWPGAPPSPPALSLED